MLTVSVSGLGDFPITIYGLKKVHRFKKGTGKPQESKLNGNRSVLFTLNGQTQYSLGKEFLENEKVDKSYIAKDVLIVVNCDQISDSAKVKLFKPDRTNLVNSKLKNHLIEQLRDLVKNEEALIELNNKRQNENFEAIKSDKSIFKKFFTKITKQSPNFSDFSKWFKTGKDFQLESKYGYQVDRKKPFKPKFYPTYFAINKGKEIFEVPQNGCVDVIAKIDVRDDYFERSKDPGKGPFITPKDFFDSNSSLRNGSLRLHIKSPKNVKIGKKFAVKVVIKDSKRKEPFEIKFKIKIVASKQSEPVELDPLKNGKWEKFLEMIELGRSLRWILFWKNIEKKEKIIPGMKKIEKDKVDGSRGIEIPFPIPVEEDDANWKDFSFDPGTGVHVVSANGGYDVYVSHGNATYLEELRSVLEHERSIIEFQYDFSMYICSLAMIDQFKTHCKPGEDYLKMVDMASRGIAIVVLSLIRNLNKNMLRN